MIVPFKFQLTDFSTINLSLNDNIQFANARFAPAVAPRQRSALARGGPYLPVSQTVTVDVFGDSPARCWANLAYLMELLDSADRWWHEDAPGSPICILVQTTRQSLAVSATILGYQETDTPLTIAEEFETAVGPRFRIRDVSFTVLRGGVWEATADATIDSALVDNPGVMSVTFATTNVNYSRVRLRGYVDGVTPSFLRSQAPGVLIVASDPNKIQVNDSTQFAKVTGPATVSTVADTTNIALGGSVIRTTANTGITKLRDAISFSTLKRRVGIWAAVRNTFANTFYVRAEVVDANENPNTTPTVPIGTTTYPQIVYLGMVTGRYDRTPAAYCNLYISAAATNAAQYLDIDYVCLACMDDPWTDRAMVIGPIATSYLGTVVNLPGDVVIEPGTSVLRTPYPITEVTLYDGSNQVVSTLPYQGDPYLVAKGTQLATAWLSTNGNGAWRIDGFPTSQSLKIGIQRARAYRVPPGAGES